MEDEGKPGAICAAFKGKSKPSVLDKEIGRGVGGGEYNASADGEIPVELSRLNLTHLGLQDNQLTGIISRHLFNQYPMMCRVSLNGNQLSFVEETEIRATCEIII